MGKTSYQMIFDQISGLHNILDSLMPEGLAVVTFWSFRLLMGRRGGEGGERGGGGKGGESVDVQMIYTFTPVADDDDYVIRISLILGPIFLVSRLYFSCSKSAFVRSCKDVFLR